MNGPEPAQPSSPGTCRPGARPRLVLASGSTSRRNLLQSAGIEPEVMVSGVDEHAVDETRPGPLALLLARRKAAAVAGQVGGDAVVVGCDSVLDLDGRPYGKPADEADAVRRWQHMRGRSGVLVTGHCALSVHDGRVAAEAAATGATMVRFGRPDDEEIRAYVASGEPLGCAGGFTIDGRGGAFVDGVDGCPSNVLGLSLPLLRSLLADIGHPIHHFW